MPGLNFSTILRETGAVAQGLPTDQSDAQLALLQSVMLERLGVNMAGLFGIDSQKANLAEIYYGQEREKLNVLERTQLDEITANQMRRAAFDKVNEFVKTVNQSLDIVLDPKSRGVA